MRFCVGRRSGRSRWRRWWALRRTRATGSSLAGRADPGRAAPVPAEVDLAGAEADGPDPCGRPPLLAANGPWLVILAGSSERLSYPLQARLALEAIHPGRAGFWGPMPRPLMPTRATQARVNRIFQNICINSISVGCTAPIRQRRLAQAGFRGEVPSPGPHRERSTVAPSGLRKTVSSLFLVPGVSPLAIDGRPSGASQK